MRLFVSVAAATLVLATSAVAQSASGPAGDQSTTASTSASGEKKAVKKADGVVCRKEIPTGSQFPVKVCTTAEQRKAHSLAASRAQESMQSAAPTLPQ